MHNAHTVNNEVPDEGAAVKQSERLRESFAKLFQRDFASSLSEKAGLCLYTIKKEAH